MRKPYALGYACVHIRRYPLSSPLYTVRLEVFDGVSFARPVPSPTIGCNPTWSFGSVNPRLLRQPSPTIVKCRDKASDDHPDANAIVCVDSITYYSMLIIRHVQFDVERPYVIPTQDTYRPNAIVTPFIPSSTDLNDMGLLTAQDEDEDDVAEEDDASSEDEDDVCLEPENIIRHYWYRNDIKNTYVYGLRPQPTHILTTFAIIQCSIR